MKIFFNLHTKIQLQHHLAEIDKVSSPNKRNCACFTPNGIVYKKIKTEKQFGGGSQVQMQRYVYVVCVSLYNFFVCFTFYQLNEMLKRFSSYSGNNENLIVGRHKRSAMEFDDFQIIYGQNMADLLKISEAVDEVENDLLSANGHHSRSKRETVDHIGNVIMVNDLPLLIP